MITVTIVSPRSTRATAAAGSSGHAVEDEHADDARLDEAEPGRRQRDRREQRGRQRDEDGCADPEPDLGQVERADDEVQAGALEQPDRRPSAPG